MSSFIKLVAEYLVTDNITLLRFNTGLNELKVEPIVLTRVA